MRRNINIDLSKTDDRGISRYAQGLASIENGSVVSTCGTLAIIEWDDSSDVGTIEKMLEEDEAVVSY